VAVATVQFQPVVDIAFSYSMFDCEDEQPGGSHCVGGGFAKLEQVTEIRKVNTTFDEFRLFAGVECDILRDGSLDFSDEVLSQLGYQPESFSDSRAALAAFEAAPGRFDVVVTDEVMPGLTGAGLANVLRRHRPDLPIVLVSGYSGPILTQDALAAGVSELLTKPLQSREIATTLARVLHRTA